MRLLPEASRLSDNLSRTTESASEALPGDSSDSAITAAPPRGLAQERA